jgi:hypothetical protein
MSSSETPPTPPRLDTTVAKAAIVAEKTQPYWFKQPVALFAPGGSWQNYFPSFRAPLLGPRNVNAITRITLLIIIIVAIAMRSWWPVAIGAGVLLLIVLLAYGWDVYQRKKIAQSLETRALVNQVGDDGSSAQRVATDVLTDYDDGSDDDSCYKDDEQYFYQQSAQTSTRQVFTPSPSPLFVESSNNGDSDIARMGNLLDGFEPPPNSSNNSFGQGNNHQMSARPPITFGVDPRTVQATMQSEDMPAIYRRSTVRSNVDAIDAIYGDGTKPASRTKDAQMKQQRQQPQTHTEKMLENMYKDVDEYAWDEMVAKRAPRWQQDPNDPRTRRKAEQEELQRGSWRGFNWSNGP